MNSDARHETSNINVMNGMPDKQRHLLKFKQICAFLATSNAIWEHISKHVIYNILKNRNVILRCLRFYSIE